MEREEQRRKLRLLVAQMLDLLEADDTVELDLPERQALVNVLQGFRKDLKNPQDPFALTEEDVRAFQEDDRKPWPPEEEIDPSTGEKLRPGKPELCQGNVERGGHCCDECDYFLDCFQEDIDAED